MQYILHRIVIIVHIILFNHKFMRLFALCIRAILILTVFLCTKPVQAQTEIDGDMMAKKLFCVGPMYGYSSWKEYWEGTLKRENLNLGKVSTSMFSLMGNYGISGKLNVLFNIPYIKTKASAGTMHGMKGIQDLSLFLKWRPVSIKGKDSRLSVIGVLGYSTPVTNYMADFLPLSIGLHSRNLTVRGMGDYQYKKLFATASAAYVFRSNITIDRNAYYTTEMHLTDKVDMPDVANFNFRTGYRSKYIVAEAVVNNVTTLGGFDITRNNMPFPSNKMNMTTVGANFRYIPKCLPDLNLNAGTDYTIAGRNVGQSLLIYGGVFYIFHFDHHAKTTYQFQN